MIDRLTMMCCALCVLVAANLAEAQEAPENDPSVEDAPTEPASITPAEPAPAEAGEPTEAASPSHWQPQWERFHWLEGVVTLAAEGAALTIYFLEPTREARWWDPAPLDTEARNALRLHTWEDQKLAVDISDPMFISLMLWPMTIDAFVLGGLVGNDWDTAWQMILIDAEVLAIAHLVTWITTRFVGRVRPRALECSIDDSCGDRGVGPVASFVSGHAMMAYAASGLTCVHHIMNPWLTGSSEGAAVMCATSLALSTTVGVLRVMTDLHWASDVAFAGLMGSAIGWGIPLVFHYARARPQLPGNVAIVPAAAGEVGLGVMGAF